MPCVNVQDGLDDARAYNELIVEVGLAIETAAATSSGTRPTDPIRGLEPRMTNPWREVAQFRTPDVLEGTFLQSEI